MVAYVAFTIRTGNFGQGQHQWDVPLSRFFQLMKVSIECDVNIH